MKISGTFCTELQNAMKIKCWYCLMSSLNAQSIHTRQCWTLAICAASYQIIDIVNTRALFPLRCVFCVIVICFSSSHNSFACGQMHLDNKRPDQTESIETNFSIFRNAFFSVCVLPLEAPNFVLKIILEWYRKDNGTIPPESSSERTAIHHHNWPESDKTNGING